MNSRFSVPTMLALALAVGGLGAGALAGPASAEEAADSRLTMADDIRVEPLQDTRDDLFLQLQEKLELLSIRRARPAP